MGGEGVFYAGETVVWIADLVDNQGRIQLDQPTNGVTIQVKNEAEDTVHLAETAMVLQADDTGTVTGADASSLTDTTKAWDEGEHEGAIVQITSGLGAGQSRRIKRNTDSILVIETPWTTEPDDTSGYKIHRARYEKGWNSDAGLAGTVVVGIIRAKDDAYTSAEKVSLTLAGAAI